MGELGWTAVLSKNSMQLGIRCLSSDHGIPGRKITPRRAVRNISELVFEARVRTYTFRRRYNNEDAGVWVIGEAECKEFGYRWSQDDIRA